MKTAQKQFADAIDALRGQVSGDVAIGLFKLYLKARNEYARQACEDLRERIAENAFEIYKESGFTNTGMKVKDSILNTEIILP